MKHVKRILGIDPGFGRTGFAVLSIEPSGIETLDFGVITTPTIKDFGSRLVMLAEDLQAVIIESKPDLMAVEQLYFTNNQKTGIQVAQARGVILLLAAQNGIPLMEFTPNQVKSSLTGDGKANKAAVQRMVKQLLGLARIPKPDDAADSLLFSLAASTMRK